MSARFKVEDVVEGAGEGQAEGGTGDYSIVGRPPAVGPAPQSRHHYRPPQRHRHRHRVPYLHHPDIKSTVTNTTGKHDCFV